LRVAGLGEAGQVRAVGIDREQVVVAVGGAVVHQALERDPAAIRADARVVVAEGEIGPALLARSRRIGQTARVGPIVVHDPDLAVPSEGDPVALPGDVGVVAA
jgi:hypothetical protein